jgi:Flp pilus assembly protein TadB
MMRNGVVVSAVLFLVSLVGCDERDARLTQLAREAANRQADQNRVMAEVQRGAQQSQAEVGRQRDELEAERRQIAQQRHRDPLIASAITTVGLVLACLLPLLLAAYILHCVQGPGVADAAVTEVLVRELVSENPLLLSPPKGRPGLERQPPPAIEQEGTPE